MYKHTENFEKFHQLLIGPKVANSYPQLNYQSLVQMDFDTLLEYNKPRM
jgi:hypothetical protein